MEEKTVITNPNNEKLVLDKHFLFLWKCEEKKNVGNHVEIRFSRDDSAPYIEDLKKLENEYPDYKIRSMVPTLILPVISILLFTAFLIIFLFNRENFNFMLYFLSLLLPAILFLVASVLFMIYRTYSFNKIAREKPEKEQEYQAKINKLIQPTIKQK